MKFFLTVMLSLMIATVGCNNKKESPAAGATAGVCPGAAIPSQSSSSGNGAGTQSGITGVALDTITTAGYTYIRIKTGASDVWVAVPQCKVAIGDTVIVPDAMPMRGYRSKTLNRTFDLVFFAGAILHKGDNRGEIPAGSAMQSISLNGHDPQSGDEANVDFSGTKKPDNGKTIAELFSAKDALNGKKVIIAGKIVHANYHVMNKTWLHLRDGTGANGSNEIVVTTTDPNPKVGQTVVVKGILVKDKNIGAGYAFALMIENGEVSEQK